MTVDPSAETAAEPAGPSTASAPGNTLGKYRLDRVLGRGGMGIVWSAFDPDLERAVAIKLLHAGDSSPTLRSRLLREARAMARLKHPNVLTVYEVGTDQNRDYIAMELVDGDNLDTWLATKPPRPEIFEALFAAGRGLAAAHAAGLVHRDFKPHNVLRSRDGHVYVTDFGLARGQIDVEGELEQQVATALPDELATPSGQRRPRDSVLDSPLTQTGVMIGTPAYMAPEQFTGRAPDPRSDQFAFCVTAWEALTGARPFRGATLEELEAAAGGGVSRALAVDLPPKIRAVLARGLAPAPADRWPDVPAMLRALADAAAPVARRRVLALALVLLIVGLGGGIAGFVMMRDKRGPQPPQPAAAIGCENPAAAFGKAWSPARAAELLRRHAGGQAFGAVGLLDGARAQWIDSYTSACAAPRGPKRTAQLTCLHSSRDSIAEVVDQVLRSPTFTMRELGPIAALGGACDDDDDDADPNIDSKAIEQEVRKILRDRLPQLMKLEPSEPPAPPTPPAPPSPTPE